MGRETYYVAALQGAPGWGARTIRQLVAALGSAQAVWTANREELRKTGYVGADRIESLLQYRRRFSFAQWEQQLQAEGMGCVSYRDENYPPLLQASTHAPALLYYQGKYEPTDRTIAMVGARSGTPYGRENAHQFAEALAQRGVLIVSGGARGIDTCAHEGALAGGGTTWAVMGCGLDITYPRENRALFQRIRDHGALLSEYAPGTKPVGPNFPARNRIIAGLSRAVLVLEAKSRSGTLITADFALSDGRDVLAVPGSIVNPFSAGCHWLIRQGAILVTKPEQILTEYGWFSLSDKKSNSQEGQPVISFNFEETCILEALASGEAVSVERLLMATEIPLSRLTTYLVQLEMQHIIAATDSGGYVLLPRR